MPPESNQTTWVRVSVPVPAGHVPSLYVHVGRWLHGPSANVRHLVPPGPDESTWVDATFTIRADKVQDFYIEVAAWWEDIGEQAATSA